MKFVNIGLGNHACWQLTVTSQGLLAATSNGIYCLTANGAIRQLSSMASNSFLDLGTEILSGEIDGVYAINKATNARNMVCKLEKVTKIIKDGFRTSMVRCGVSKVTTRSFIPTILRLTTPPRLYLL